MKRQATLYRAEPTPYTAIVHEAALRMRFGGPDIARGQLQHILDMSEHLYVSAPDNTTVRLRESDQPDTILTTTPRALSALIRSAKAGRLDHLGTA